MIIIIIIIVIIIIIYYGDPHGKEMTISWTMGAFLCDHIYSTSVDFKLLLMNNARLP